VTIAALSFIGAGIILHVGIGLRWPFAMKTEKRQGRLRRLRSARRPGAGRKDG